ncbi:hypothetical protein EDD16DRAFT_1548420 [Pisolithus croceorrhizus]|nr:hypothetical protein EDD16DRAFT_1548420 [Pisolithus croceorrhizus]
MSSWSAPTYPPQPRRSRSRSPTRGAYDHRGGAWDSFERDRAWPEYDRDRAAYEYARRGRSRSPPPDEVRKRRRSMSPYDRERYDPRPRYGDDYDAHSRSYSYRRAPPDPRSMDHPATLKQYAEWFRYYFPQQAQEEDNLDKAAEQEAGDGSKPRNGIRSRWEKYKKEFFANQLQTMFDHHRKSPWFAEKYDPSPEFVALRRRVRKEGWRGKLDAFLHDLEAGKYDPDLNESESELPVTKESNTSGGPGDGTAPEEAKNAADDDMQFNMDAEEDAAAEVNGRVFVDNKRGNRGEEISVLPEGNQVMIRTIPPDIGRFKLEEACNKIPGYINVNFYRAGWIRFRDDADMTAVMNELTDKKVGYTSHTTRNPLSIVFRYVPEVASKPDRIEKDLANAKVLASILEDEASALRKSLPPSAGGDGMDTNGDGDTHAGNEDDPEPNEGGSQALHEQGPVISLDLYLAYLRAAFHACYYCAVVTDHAEELQRKCLKHVRKPLSKSMLEEVKAVEAEKAEKEKKEEEKETDTANNKPPENRDWKRNDERWLEWFDSKIALLINRAGIDPRDYGGKSYDDELSKAVEPYIKQEDEGRFRCKTCQKLFKATSFVEKHIANKHPELVRQLDEIPYFNNFALDPHRIQPFAHPPPATGNNQAPPQAYGIQGPTMYPPDYGRPNSYYGVHPPAYVPPPPYVNAGYWDHYGYHDRISGYAVGFDQQTPEITLPTGAGLPPKPVVTMDAPLDSSHRKGSRRQGVSGGPPPPPPPDAKEDPRAAAGKKVSYHDMDLVAEGDVELTY